MMKSFIRVSMGAGALLALGGCTDFALRDLREAQFTGTAFQQRLAMEYRELSEDQVAVYDWGDAQHFAQKGMLAAYGGDVQPDAPTARRIGPDALPVLQDAHRRLMAARTPEILAQKPKAMAFAQAQYDNWLEQQEEGWRADAIASARENFEAALAKALGTAPRSNRASVPVDEHKGTIAVTPPAADAAEETVPMAYAQQDYYVLLFPTGSTSISRSGQALLAKIAQELRAAKQPWNIMLNGHTDRVGAEDFNLLLSEQRAHAVRRALVQLGLPSDRIEVYAFGESDPKVATEDGMPNLANRRVEIFLN